MENRSALNFLKLSPLFFSLVHPSIVSQTCWMLHSAVNEWSYPTLQNGSEMACSVRDHTYGSDRRKSVFSIKQQKANRQDATLTTLRQQWAQQPWNWARSYSILAIYIGSRRKDLFSQGHHGYMGRGTKCDKAEKAGGTTLTKAEHPDVFPIPQRCECFSVREQAEWWACVRTKKQELGSQRWWQVSHPERKVYFLP